MKRKFYLDNLKICLTVLVIFHHAGQAYEGGGGWPYSPSNPSEVMPYIWHFFCANASFFMGLFFLISGFLTPSSYDRQGFKIFVKKKVLKLGLPLLLIGGALSIGSHRIELAHLWYLESLLLFCLIYAIIRLFSKQIKYKEGKVLTLPYLTLFAILLGIGSLLIRRISPQDNWIDILGFIHIEPAHYLQYIMMFSFGIIASRYNLIDTISNRVGLTSLLLGVVLILGIYLRNGGPWNSFVTKWFGIYESFLSVFLNIGLLWFSFNYLNKSYKFTQWLSNQAYGVYIIHLFVILAIQFTFDNIWIGAFGKFIFVGIMTTIISFTLIWSIRQLFAPIKRKK